MAREFTVGAAVDIDMGANVVGNVADPVADQDAATKKYVDDNTTGDNAGGEGRAVLATQVAASTISNSKYNAFGIMDQLPNGDLFTIYREGTSHLSDAGVLKMRTSTDGGRTWSSATTVASEAGVDLRNCGGGVTPTGRIVLFYGRYNYSGAAWLNQGYIYSDDQGATWSSYATISHGSDTSFSPTGNMIESAVGTLLQCWYGDDGTNYRLRVIASTDDGATWGSAVVIANSTTVRYTEADIANLGGSYIAAMIRTDNGTTFSQALSSDGGASWSVQGTTSFDSWTTPSPPRLIAYPTVNGKREVACYYMNRDATTMRVVYATADSLIAGTTGWGSYTGLGSSANTDSGYQAVIHPGNRAVGVGWFYTGSSSSVKDMKFFVATGSGVVVDDDLLLSDVTTANVSTTKHGLAPKAPNDATKFLDGTAAWDTVKDSDLSLSDITTNNASTSNHGFLKKLDNDTTHFMRGDGSWAAPTAGSSQHILLADGHATPFVFNDLLQMDDGSDFMWSDPA